MTLALKFQIWFYYQRAWSFISTLFFVLNLDHSFGVLSNKFIIFGLILLLNCFINLRSSIILCLSSGDRCFSTYFFIVFIFNCFWMILLRIFWNTCDFISNFITNQITSCVCCFLSYSFRSSFNYFCYILFSMIKRFLAVFTAYVLIYIFRNFLLIFLAK